MYRPACHWVRCKGVHLPHNAVAGGKDKGDEVTYVGRALHEGNLLPGKVVPSSGICYFGFDGKEPYTKDYQALVSDGASLDWLPGSGGKLPSGAVQGGVSASGEPLYVGRASREGLLVIGAVQPSEKCLLLPFDGKEHRHTNYEVLVCKTINF
ncbi:uncharacterized protein [Dermacentor andersoni]|uniref:uncharacterized protein n=1 Tax=Dermacentor andersoni TaxID=34620 RepID=UPI002417CAC3|nr:uncharacterized protein LOC126539607 [Dermacentor andersoni]